MIYCGVIMVKLISVSLMKINYLSFIFWLLPFLLTAQLEQFDRSSVLIVRLQSNRNKIEALEKKIELNASDDNVKQQLERIKLETDIRNKLIINAFVNYFDYAEVVFIYDTASTALKNGNWEGLLFDKDLQNSNLSLAERTFLVVSENVASTSMEGLILMNPDLVRVAHQQLKFTKINTFFLQSRERIFERAVDKFNKRFYKYLPISLN
jgi:hypothetical protein